MTNLSALKTALANLLSPAQVKYSCSCFASISLLSNNATLLTAGLHVDTSVRYKFTNKCIISLKISTGTFHSSNIIKIHNLTLKGR